ncbi:MAG: hypothetical protein KC713_03795 [Candidatus Omnitrophica bacterium]|nr:hypothetical protein [Candidatus Omnitrophota bacterium]
MPTRSTTNIKRRLYQIAFRLPQSFVAPTDLSEWGTFLSTFAQIGYVRRSSIEALLEPGGSEELDNGNEITTEWSLSVQFAALQTGIFDIADYHAMQNLQIDLLLYNADALRAIFYPTLYCTVRDSIKGGETDVFLFDLKRKAAAITALRTHFNIPTS